MRTHAHATVPAPTMERTVKNSEILTITPRDQNSLSRKAQNELDQLASTIGNDNIQQLSKRAINVKGKARGLLKGNEAELAFTVLEVPLNDAKFFYSLTRGTHRPNTVYRMGNGIDPRNMPQQISRTLADTPAFRKLNTWAQEKGLDLGIRYVAAHDFALENINTPKWELVISKKLR